MAEHVFQNLEGMLPELEDLERNGIFSRNELRTIIKKRTDLEYKLQRRVVDKEDFLKYLQYELNVDSLRRKRTHRLGLKTKHSAAETGILKRMHFVFQKALKKFGNDLKLWMQYIDFCKKTDSKASLGRAFGRLIQLHPRNASAWIMAAKYEFEENRSIDNARIIMQRSLRMNKDSKTLWLEYFRLELLHVDKIKKRRDILSISTEGDELASGTLSEVFLSNKTASIVVDKAMEAFPDDIEFLLSFLPVYRLFKDTKKNQDEIYDKLARDFSNNEKAQDAIAKRPLDDMISSGNSQSDEDWQAAEDSSCSMYNEAVEKIKTGSMYECYLQTFLELLKQDEASQEQTTRRLKTILKIFNAAAESGLITEQLFLAWSELLLNIGDEQGSLDVLSKAVDIMPKASLYERYLTLKNEWSDDWESLNKEFQRCVESLEKSESLTIWKLWLNITSTRNPKGMKDIFERSLSASKEIAEFGRLQYLRWIYDNDGIKAARKIYKRLHNACPLTMKFVQNQIDLESQQEIPNIKELRKLYETAVSQFGKLSAECWLDFIKFELNQPGTAVETVNRTYWRALKILENQHVGEFVEKYSLLQAGSKTSD